MAKILKVKAATKEIDGVLKKLIVYRNTDASKNFGGRISNDEYVPVEIDSLYLINAIRDGDLLVEDAEGQQAIEN